MLSAKPPLSETDNLSGDIVNRKELQELLNNPGLNGEIRLPSGEFEGPFSVNSPCRVIGNSTTLWRGRGPVLTVNAENVTLENLRIEITNDSLPAGENISVLSQKSGTKFSNVEVIGRIGGIDGEDSPWGIPKMLSLGKFPAETECSCTAEIIVPVEAELISISHDITVSPERLTAGTNTVTVTIAPIRKGSYVYGELLLRSAVTRRIYVSGSADDTVTDFENGKIIFKADAAALAEEEKILEELSFEEEIIYPELSEPLPEKNEMYKPEISEIGEETESLHSLYIINRGMSVPIKCASAEIELLYDNKDFPMEVDAFAFMADKHGNVTRNDRFIFFGNDHSEYGEVRYLNAPDKKAIYINFNILPLDVSEIDIAYSIYENPAMLNFRNLKNPAISVKLSDEMQLIYRLEPPLNENTLVGLQIVYSNSRWELTPLGMIYPMGLASLCGNYGLKIT